MQFTRGDTFQFYFQRHDAAGEVIQAPATKLFFTVKHDKATKVPAVQKKFLAAGGSDGITFDVDNDKAYHVRIDAEDTETLDFGDYIYDIEVTANGYVQTIAKGTLTLLSEATWKVNKT